MSIERSSPLAAIQPNHGRIWGGCRSYNMEMDSRLLGPSSFDPPSLNFNFKDMSMENSKASDYFSWKPMRGSSPTASLAADLSQNLDIERSPQVPTPRRALFTNGAVSLLSKTQDIITPPIASSSPTPSSEVSPLLVHKPAFIVQQPPPQFGLPTPDPTPVETEFPTINAFQPVPLEQPKRPVPQHQRKFSNTTRPSLRKGYSMNCVESKLNGTSSNESPFVFGSTSRMLKMPLETFAESPPSEKKLNPSTSTPSLLDAPRPPQKMMFPNNGSPMGALRRASLSRASGPRIGMTRRTQSLQYGNPVRPMRQDKRCCTEGSVTPSIGIQQHVPSLPHFKPEDEVDGFPRLTAQTFIEVMNGAYSCQTDIIDCRFEYEYQGGHIDGAVNFNDKEQLAQKLFEPGQSGNKTLIFHCEYSNFRAPDMAKFIRQRDRAINEESYPNLTYPEIYILDGGYSAFFSTHPDLCFPRNYVEMEDKQHESACARGMANLKRRAKLSRAQTYAFGQSSASFASKCLTSKCVFPTKSSAARDQTEEVVEEVQEGVSNLRPLPMDLEPIPSDGFEIPASDDAMDVDFSSSIMSMNSPLPASLRSGPRRFDSY